jgi:hypothetical protein
MRKNLDNVLSEWLIVVGVAVCVIAALSVVASQRASIWQQEQAQMPSTSDVRAPQQVLILETPSISSGLERVQ